ncbi:uncharacterized protein LOC116844977 [Odontomachus brunneus]|uniref:uncharacterized protein LOC116844977 n=1 Tax=Odontomachus brunneus TaxID=486640 RepID=UPI0013F27490|nr:uncharacterized protein LOC116844977 [Odontomachus brunneus]
MGVRKGKAGQLVAQNTIFGWILSGPFSCQAQLESRVHVHCTTSVALDQELRRFLEVEEVPRRLALSLKEQLCEDHFVTTHSRAPNGRYVVRLPFRKGLPTDISASRHIAKRSLRQLHRRLKTQPSLASEYISFIREYEELSHMRRVDGADSQTTQCVYITHHLVLREHSSTTHLRVVFNASCASSNTTSLNDYLLPGPKLQTDLAAVILRWRTHKYVMSADIAKMYHQILIDPCDANYQRILWAPSETLPTAEFSSLPSLTGPYLRPFSLFASLNNSFGMKVTLFR